MSFVTDAAMQEHLKSALHLTTADKPTAYYVALASKANKNAYHTILNILIGRGYTKAQIDAWPGGASFQEDLGVFWAMVKGGAANPSEYDATLLKLLDRRAELAEVTITDAAWEEVDTGGSSFTTGAYDTDDDIFVHPDKDDPNLGEIAAF